MTQKDLLKIVIKKDGGFLLEREVKEILKTDDDVRLLQKLINQGFVIGRTKKHYVGGGRQIEAEYISVSEKGYSYLDPWYMQFWNFIKQDIRSVIVALVTSLLVMLSSLLVQSYLWK